MTEGEIQKALGQYFQAATASLCNTYILGHEADYFFVTKNGKAHEVEIKRTRQDFENDFGKSKWAKFRSRISPVDGSIVYDRSYPQGGPSGNACNVRLKHAADVMPAFFWYAAPPGVINSWDLDMHTGLIWVTNRYPHTEITVVKKPIPQHRFNYRNYEQLTKEIHQRALQQNLAPL